MTTDIKPYTDAMKLDIINILEKPDIGVFELRKIQNLAKTMVDFVNSVGTYSEQEAFGLAMRETSDDIAPTLHAALMSRTFDGESATKDLYLAMLEKYSDLKSVVEEVGGMRRQLAAGPNRLKALAADLEVSGTDVLMDRVKQLTAGTAGEAVDALAEEDEAQEACPKCHINRNDPDRECCNRRCHGQLEIGCGCCHHSRFWDDEGETDDTGGRKGTLV